MAKHNSPQKHGSVGNSTFQGGPYGLIERQRVEPRNPRTLAQQNIRSRVKSFAGKWRELSEAQRTGWRALASQRPTRLGGCQLYIGLNVVCANCGLPQLEAAPPPPVFGLVVATGLVADDTPTVRLTQMTATVAPERFIVDASPPLSAGILKVGRRWRQLTVVRGHAGPGVDLDMTAAYVARFGAPQAGQRLFVRLSAMSNGFRDAPVQFETIVAPHTGPQ
jgi:hypothetical protein